MNKTIKLIILFVVIIALCIALYFIKGITTQNKNPQLLSISSKDIVNVSWTKEGCRPAILTKNKDGKWECEGIIIKDAYINDIYEALGDLRAEEIISDFDDLGAFGLLDPELAAIVQTKDTTYEFLIGDMNPYTQGYYIQIVGDKNVYLLPKLSKLQYAFNYDIDMLLQNQ